MIKCFLGTELKLLVSIEPIGGKYMKDYDFKIEVYTSTPEKGITASKIGDTESGWLRRNNTDSTGGSYYVLVDTGKIGIGKVKCKVTAYIPDTDFGGDGGTPDATRTEIDIVNTGIEVIKTI